MTLPTCTCCGHTLFPADAITRTLTATQARVYDLVRRRGQATATELHELVYAGRADGGPDVKAIEVIISQMRKRLKPFGITLKCDYRWGYRIVELPRAMESGNLNGAG